MNHAITIGDLFWPTIIIGGVVLFLVVVGVILSIFADAFKH